LITPSIGQPRLKRYTRKFTCWLEAAAPELDQAHVAIGEARIRPQGLQELLLPVLAEDLGHRPAQDQQLVAVGVRVAAEVVPGVVDLLDPAHDLVPEIRVQQALGLGIVRHDRGHEWAVTGAHLRPRHEVAHARLDAQQLRVRPVRAVRTAARPLHAAEGDLDRDQRQRQADEQRQRELLPDRVLRHVCAPARAVSSSARGPIIGSA
jgi:hypothetical protein